MWEFFSKKKEASSPEPVVSVETKLPDSNLSFEASALQASERAQEKYAAILSQQATATSAAAVVAVDVDQDATRLGQVTDAATRVNQLVELAQVKGVVHAVSVARKLDDFYVLDTMHDELADTLYDALKAKGLILGE